MVQSPEVTRFQRVSEQRLLEAEVLRDAGYSTGAVYLAGYAVECILKALALSSHPRSRHQQIVRSFRGRHAHDHEWIRSEYMAHLARPRNVTRALADATGDTWSTDLRYEYRNLPDRDVHRFFSAAKTILAWCEGRLS